MDQHTIAHMPHESQPITPKIKINDVKLPTHILNEDNMNIPENATL